jgi:UDP-2,3-diacylglucosamine pyrophosphatase LpxH
MLVIGKVMSQKINALFLSDIHLGSKGCNSKEVLEVLKMYQPKKLFLVGDIIDGWLLKKRIYWTQDYIKLIRKILNYSKNGTDVIYVTGNHDDFLRQYTPMYLGNIKVVNSISYKNYLIIHGDQFDGVVKLKWLGVIGSYGYELALVIDRTLKRFGYKKSLSKILKDKVKKAVKFITDFEKQLAYQAYIKNYEGVICGHIHKPEDKFIGVKDKYIRYLNTGDWIENNSYIIYDGTDFKLLTFN